MDFLGIIPTDATRVIFIVLGIFLVYHTYNLSKVRKAFIRAGDDSSMAAAVLTFIIMIIEACLAITVLTLAFSR